jgi:hypothetical protein
MDFPHECYDPETLDLMTGALDAAWDEVELAGVGKVIDPTGLRTVMAVRIMAAVRDGEQEPERLKELALEAIAKAY